MRSFNYSKIKDKKWDSEVLSLVASIYRYQGKQELYLNQKPEELNKLIEIAKIQSTKASNEIEGYRDVLNIIPRLFTTKP